MYQQEILKGQGKNTVRGPVRLVGVGATNIPTRQIWALPLQRNLSKGGAIEAIWTLNEAALVYCFPTRMEISGTLPHIVSKQI